MESGLFNSLLIMGLYSIPMYMIYTSFSLLFWGVPLAGYLRKIILFSVIEALYLVSTIFILPLPAFTFNSIASFLVFFCLIFRSLTLYKRILIALFALITAAIMEGFLGFAVLKFFPRRTILDHPLELALFSWPVLITFILVTYYFHRSQIYPGHKIYMYFLERHKRSTALLLAFTFLQFIALLLLESFSFDNPFPSRTSFFNISLFITATLSLVIILFTLRTLSHIKDDAVRMTQQVYIDDINKLYTSIRGQRHDFLNHVQVIHTMVSLSKMEDLKKYTQELVGEISEINELTRIGHPAVAALMQSKLVFAAEHKIKFHHKFVHIKDISLGLKSIDIVKISGNLIDNAFDEVMKLPALERWVELHMRMEEKTLHISVRNPGKVISSEEIARIFTPGYSTKANSSHSGLGLAIVKERVEHYKGQLTVESTQEHGTIFRVEIPLNRSMVV